MIENKIYISKDHKTVLGLTALEFSLYKSWHSSAHEDLQKFLDSNKDRVVFDFTELPYILRHTYIPRAFIPNKSGYNHEVTECLTDKQRQIQLSIMREIVRCQVLDNKLGFNINGTLSTKMFNTFRQLIDNNGIKVVEGRGDPSETVYYPNIEQCEELIEDLEDMMKSDPTLPYQVYMIRKQVYKIKMYLKSRGERHE